MNFELISCRFYIENIEKLREDDVKEVKKNLFGCFDHVNPYDKIPYDRFKNFCNNLDQIKDMTKDEKCFLDDGIEHFQWGLTHYNHCKESQPVCISIWVKCPFAVED